MRTKLILLLLLCQNAIIYSQDGAFMGYHFSIKFEQFQPKESSDSIVSVSFYKNVNALPNSNRSKQTSIHLMKNDLDSASFAVSEGHSFIGSSPQMITPPTLFMNIEIERKYTDGAIVHYIKTIPILFVVPLKNFARIALTEVNVQSYLGVPSDEIAIRVLSETTFEIVDQSGLETRPVLGTLIRFE